MEKKDRRKSYVLVLVYSVIGIMDVAAVFLLGLVGSLAVSGVSNSQQGNRVNALLTVFGINGIGLQAQVAILGCVSAVGLVAKSIISFYLSQRTLFFLSRRAATISRTLIFRVLGQQMLKVREKTVQETIYALTTGVNAVAVGIIGSTTLLIADLFLVTIFSISLFVVDTLVAVMSLILFATIGISLYFLMHKKATQIGENVTQLNIKSNESISEIIACHRELLVKNRKNFYAEQIGAIRFEIAEANAKLSAMSYVSKYVMEITLVVGGLLIGVAQFVTQPATRAVAVLAIFLVASARIGPAVLRIQTGLITLRTNIAIATPTLSLIEESLNSSKFEFEKPYKFLSRKQFEHKEFTPSIEIEKVSFSYPQAKNTTINEFTVRIESGDFVGIVGSSGAGKTTLADILLGLLNPDQGKVQISGMNPLEVFRKWPGAVAYVPQEVSIFNGTVKSNVCLGFDESEVSDEEVSGLLELVQLSEFSTREGLRTPTGERGNRISGGQRQRIGLARALFTNPRLVILDEATSSLDSLTERKITDFLDAEKGKLTLVVIAHRLSTLQSADKILYIKSGNLIGEGSFDFLRKELPEFELQVKQMGIE